MFRYAALVVAILFIQPVLGSSIVVDMPNIYANDDLILVNPQQSTAIFLTVIVASTVLELFLGTVAKRRNLYYLMMVQAIKEEITVIGFCIMSLQFAGSSFPELSPTWKTVAAWVTASFVYISFMYVGTVIFLAPQMKRRAQMWRTFEWARIDADSHHSATEEIFKLSRRFFVQELSNHFRQEGEELTNIPPVALSSYTYFRSIEGLKEIFDFSLKTWLILGLFVLINGMRTITIDSLGGSTVLPQTITFLIIIGYLVLLLQFVLATVLERRLRQFLIKQLSPDSYKGESDAMSCLFLASSGATYELTKGFLLTIMWFFVYFMLAFLSASIKDMGYISILFVFLAIPPPIGVLLLTPWIIHTVCVCEALSAKNRESAIEHLEGGCVVLDEVDDDVLAIEDADGIVYRKKMETEALLSVPIQERGHGGGAMDRELDGIIDDEYNGPTINLGHMNEEAGMRGPQASSVGALDHSGNMDSRMNDFSGFSDRRDQKSISRSRGMSINHFGHRRGGPNLSGDPSKVHEAPVTFWEPS